MLYKILTVAGLATFEIYAAIPAGFAFGISAWMIFFTTVVGGLAGVFIAAFLGKHIQQNLSRYRKPKPKKENKKPLNFKICDKYREIG